MSARIYMPPDPTALIYDEGGAENRFRFDRDFEFAAIPGFDAAENFFLLRQLRHLIPGVIEHQLPDISARTIFPLYFANDDGAETFGYERVESFGKAEVVSNYANNPPTTEVTRKEHDGVVFGIWNAFTIDVQEVRAQQKASRNGAQGPVIGEAKAKRARDANLREENEIAWHGDADNGGKGFFSDEEIPREDAPGTITSRSAEQNLTMLHEFADATPLATNYIYKPDTLVMPNRIYDFLSRQVLGSGDNARPKVLDEFLKENAYVKNILAARELANADSNGSGAMALFKRELGTVRLNIFVDNEQFPPERHNGVVRTIYHMRSGGVTVHRSKNCRIMEGVA